MTHENVAFFSDFQHGFRSSQSTAGLLEVVYDRIVRAFIRSGATQAPGLIYPRLSTEFGVLAFFTNLGLMEFQVRYLGLFLYFSVIGGFGWFWMRNIQLMLEFLKSQFLVLPFSYYKLLTS